MRPPGSGRKREKLPFLSSVTVWAAWLLMKPLICCCRTGEESPSISLRPDGELCIWNRSANVSFLYPLGDQEFMEAIFELGGTPREVLQHKEILSLFLPILREDYRISETYVYRERPPFPFDITVMYGTEDRTHLPNVPEWSRHTGGECRLKAYEGDHFFLNDSRHRTEMIVLINHTLRSVPAAGLAAGTGLRT
ncbi:thioesterase [Paenibacillus mucilaginosus 3016]|uniref:Thioesterase n=1 Tax=Paenibacillus mucilaginosus 3016 TaxID=1116391 RepID=H6NFR7_9BACL|nr:thioesterase [Paenibacillus mucilaginosus 3016]